MWPGAPKDGRYSAMVPLLGSRVPTAHTERRTSRQGFQPLTRPHPRGLITPSARYGPPNLPAILQTGTLMGLHPSELLPPDRAAPGFPGRCLHAVCHTVHLRRFRRCVAAPRLCSLSEVDTCRRVLPRWKADALMGLCPSSVTLPLGRRSRRTNLPTLEQQDSRSRQVAVGYKALSTRGIGLPLARLPTLMGFPTFSENRYLRNQANLGL